MMARKLEHLPKGLFSHSCQQLRVQVRCKGHKTEVRTFALFADTPFERQRQTQWSEAWVTEIRRKRPVAILRATDIAA